MSKLLVGLSTLVLSFVVLNARPDASGGDHPDLVGLSPGEFVVHRQRVPVRIVLIGFDRDQVKAQDIRHELPGTYRPVVRVPLDYGLSGRNMGLEYTFDYELVRKGSGFADRLFEYLLAIGTEGPLTTYQTRYNAQSRNVLDVTGPVLYIDAPSVERWLQTHDDQKGPGYTAYFINWYGRDDFRFHVFTKTDEPDPDTDFNFGLLSFNAISSWGGTSSRSWFYDFSAGPEFNMSNWVVDVEDLTADGVPEYRMPAIWEYADNGYRAPALLGQDIGLLTRYVAINLLFTSSPLYDPLITAPGALGRKIADTSLFEDDPASQGSNFLDVGFARQVWRRFQPYYLWATPSRDLPIDLGAKQALDIFTLNNVVPGCWQEFLVPFAQLFCYFEENLATYVPSYRDRDYVVESFLFNTTEAGLGVQLGLLGFADDNWVDGTQTFVFTFGSELYRSLGYGFTSTLIHEVGHHIGMSHPHDGYDFESDLDYSPTGLTYFAWEGDESDTVMHYMGVSNTFGRHNEDNMYRWETAGYLNWANALAGAILMSPDADRVRLAVKLADIEAALAKKRFQGWDYLQAAASARLSYATLAAAADAIGVSSSSLNAARMAIPGMRPMKEGDRPRQLLERLAQRP
jgi:hypothetical protein